MISAEENGAAGAAAFEEAEAVDLLSMMNPDTLHGVSSYFSPMTILRLEATCRTLRDALRSDWIWQERLLAQFGADRAAAIEVLGALAGEAPSNLDLFRAAWRLSAVLDRLVLVQGPVDISRPPPIRGGVMADAIMVTCHPGLVSSGLPGAHSAVNARAGPQLDRYIQEHIPQAATEQGIKFGDVAVTPGFKLPVGKVFHAIGPMPGYTGVVADDAAQSMYATAAPPAEDAAADEGGDAKERAARREAERELRAKLMLTQRTYRSVYAALDEQGLRTIQMASIGTGLAGVPPAAGARIGMQCLVDWVLAHVQEEGFAWAEDRAVSFACYEKRVLDACSEVRAELLRACLKPLWSSARLEAAVAEGASEERCVVM